jgi:hypothetical protein
VPWLRRLVAGLSPQRPGFEPWSVHVGFVVDKVALGQVFPCQFHSTGVPLLGKNKKKIIAFVTGLHNKPQGCSASVAFAAGPFTTKKNLLVAIQTVCVSTPAHKGASSWFICRPVQNCKKATASFVLLVCVYVGPHGTTRLPVNRFCKHFILGIYIKICLHFPVFVKVGQK